MQLLRGNDEAAFNEIYSRFHGLLFVYAARISGDDHEAADLVQEVFINLWDKRAVIGIDTSLKAFLYTAVRYKFFDRLDKKKVRADYMKRLQQFLEEGQYNTDEYIRYKELEALIEKGITALPPKMQEIFLLSRKLELSHKEIANHLDVTEKTVRNQVHNALRILRSKLGLFGYFLFFFR